MEHGFASLHPSLCNAMAHQKRKRVETHWHMNQASGYDWIARETRLAIYLRDNNRCLACGSEENLTLNHLRRDVPKPHHPSNLVTLCLSCNSSLRSADPAEWDPNFARRAARHVRRPIDRAAGLALAKARWPQRYAAKAERDRRRNERRVNERASSSG